MAQMTTCLTVYLYDLWKQFFRLLMLVVQKLHTLHLGKHAKLCKSYLKTNTHGFPMKPDALQIEVCLKCKMYQNYLIIKSKFKYKCLTKHATLVLKLNYKICKAKVHQSSLQIHGLYIKHCDHLHCLKIMNACFSCERCIIRYTCVRIAIFIQFFRSIIYIYLKKLILVEHYFLHYCKLSIWFLHYWWKWTLIL